MTPGSPLVIVPVLSSTIVSTSFSVWIAAPLRTRTPFSAPIPVPTISAVGVASPSAQGQAMTSTATAAKIASETVLRPGSTQGRNPEAHPATERSAPGNTSQATNVAAATARTVGTKIAVTRSANSWIGTLVPCASSTMRITLARKVSSPTPVARTRSTPSLLIVAPITRSPSPFSTGSDSPVAMDSSTEEWPPTTSPSVGIFSPGRTIMTSPTSTSSIGTSTSSPSRSTRAVFASSDRSFWMAAEVRPRALVST